MPPIWRKLTKIERGRIARQAFDRMLIRYEEGAIEHGETFMGDPLDQLETELMDAIFYLAMARRERDAASRGTAL